MLNTRTKSLFQTKDLLLAWTSRNLRARYQQSALGWTWAIAQPAAQVAIFTLIFTFFVPIDTGPIPYIVFSSVALVPWTFLATSLTDMAGSFVTNMSLVTKIYFPREVLPLAAMLARLMDFGIAAALVFVLILVFQIPLVLPALLFLPVILGIQLMLVIGLGLLFATANVFFRDVQSLLILTLQIWFYASPIIYPVSVVPESLRPFYYLNPMAGIIEAYRSVLLYGQLPGASLLVSALGAVIALVIGYWSFKRVEYKFADIV